MADDPHRDLLPVREGSCINTCRSSIIDPRERHAVCKLDRYQLEDRYLRLLDEVQHLKKLSNTQEDKIKRLATKLMRVAATPRSCLATALDFNNDGNRVACLEHENIKLKDKIKVLRNQILNHKIGASQSRNRRLQMYSSSGAATFRSEAGRLENSSSSRLIRDAEDEKVERKNLEKIEELEIEKKDMTSRIAELENQLENCQVGKQREKAAENIEFIRVWREMKQQAEQLVSAQAVNVSLSREIRDLKQQLEEKTRNNNEMTGALLAEKKKLAEIDEKLARAKTSQLSLREKDEEIKDLMSEMKILHQHNAELIALSSKYSQVEEENAELKKKISEQLSDHQSLKSAFTNEQANITALQAANEQLMGKLRDLQRNIDSLTIQLKSFQSQTERRERTESEIRIVRTVDRETSTDSLSENLVAPSEGEHRHGVPKSESRRTVDREIQTESHSCEDSRNVRREEVEEKCVKRNAVQQSPMRADRSFQPENGSACLMPEEMLKLLEEAQINVPLDVQNSARMRQLASTLPKEYLNSTEPSQRQREHDVDCPGFRNLENCVTRTRRLNEITEPSDCSFEGHTICKMKEDYGYAGAQSFSKQEFVELDKFQRCQRDLIRNPFRNVVCDIGTCIQKTFDNIHLSRIIRADGTFGERYKSCQTSKAIINSTKPSSNEKGFNTCGRPHWDFSAEETEDTVVEKSKQVVMSVAKNCIVKPNCIVPNCMLGNRCREDCRGGEFFLKTGCCCHSLNNQVEKQSVTSRGSKSIENGTSILPKGSPELQHEKLHQVDNRNDLVKPLASRQSRNSSMIRSMQGSLRNGASKNTEIRRESNIDSYLSSSVEQSDSSVIRAMEDEDATSEDIRNRVKKRQIASMERMTKKVEAGSREDDTEILDSESVNEFNSLIRNNTILSPRESSSSVQDLGTVFSDDNWHEYKARSMASQAKVSGPPIGTTDDRNGSSNLFPNRSFRSDNAVIIRIESLTLDHKCQLLEDPEVHQLYVEFSFLGYHGVDLETMSVPKPSANATAYFNYMRKFEIDEEDHQMQRSIMRAMMTDDDNPTVKFTVVSEPLPSEMEIKECMEVGYAYLNIRDHVLSGGSNQVPLTIVNLKQTEPIGILKITLLGAEVIRRCMSDLV